MTIETTQPDKSATTGRGLPADLAMQVMQNTLDKLNTPDFNAALRSLGIPEVEPLKSPQWDRLDYIVEQDAVRLRRNHNGEAVSFSTLGIASDEPIGVPGTKIIDGRIEIEPNTRYRSYNARGRLSNPGSNHEVYVTEPVIFSSINEITSLITSAAYEPNIHADISPRIQKEILRHHRAIKRAMHQGDFLNNGSTFLQHGFAPFEVLWNRKTKTVAGIEFREQSTVERWLFCDRQSRWQGTEYRTGGTHGQHYIIPNGDTLEEARSLLINLHAFGNNLEGISPVRVATGFRRLKELILQGYGVSYMKYAVPIAMIITESLEIASNLVGEVENAEHIAELQTLVNTLQDLRSRYGAVVRVPQGYRIEYVTPTGDIPDPLGILNYLDSMLALCFGNGSATMNGNSFGSYALSATLDDKFLRSAPTYAGRIAKALTDLLHKALRINLGDDVFYDLPELPQYGFRFSAAQDASKYLKDLAATITAITPGWTPEVRQSAASTLGLPLNALDTVNAAPAAEPAVEETPEVTDGN